MKTTAIVLTAAMLAATSGLTAARADDLPPMTVAATDGGVEVGVDVLQTGRGWRTRTADHFRAHKWKYIGTAIAGGAVYVGERNDWFQSDKKSKRAQQPVPSVETHGEASPAMNMQVVVQGDGNTVIVHPVVNPPPPPPEK